MTALNGIQVSTILLIVVNLSMLSWSVKIYYYSVYFDVKCFSL
jgi:hypothetical protein